MRGRKLEKKLKMPPHPDPLPQVERVDEGKFFLLQGK
jgi:hypothetical protein